MSDLSDSFQDSYNGSFASDSARITFAPDLGRSSKVGIFSQNLAFIYAQKITRIYEVGTNFSFYVAGRTQGNLSVGRIIGPRPVMIEFYKKYGSTHDVATNHLDIQLSAGCKQIGSLTKYSHISMKYCMLSSIAISVAAIDMMINEQLSVMFASLGCGASDKIKGAQPNV